jgi:cytidylate kinase/transcriptional regulator with XRE-family HTH domain
MIKNERQYRISKAHAEKFRAAIKMLETGPPDSKIHPILRKAEIAGLHSQLADLERDIHEYERLRSGRRTAVKIERFADLPRVLIQSRIAAGMTQEQLATKLKLKPQQIQRYEATGYQSASLARIGEIVHALDVKVSKSILSPDAEGSLSMMVRRLVDVGLEKGFVLQRLLPKPPGILVEDVGEWKAGHVPLEAAEAISRIYGWSPAVLFGREPLHVEGAPAAQARFKLPARVRKAGLAPYVVYAHYLALLVLEATTDLPVKPLPGDPAEVRRAIIASSGEVTFESALKYVWSLGIPVLPLNDAGGFNGACWRVNGRNVIVLRQRTRSAARWLHDLLHEYFHAATDPELEEHPIIEEDEMSPSRRRSAEEQSADQFAGNVMLDGRAEQIVERCVEKAHGKVEYLKSVVPQVAIEMKVGVDALANYVAWRLSLQGINWWGTATNLQEDGSAMMCSPRDLLLSRGRLARLNSIDRDLLLRALEPIVLALSGRIGSGKTTLSHELADALGWKRASFGEYVRAYAKSQGLDDNSRDVLQAVGQSLVEKDAVDFCRSVLAHFGWTSGEPLVIDGIRHSAVVDALRKIVAPLDLRVVYVDVSEKTRLKRIRDTDKDVVQRMNEIEAHATEREVPNAVRALAARHIEGDRPVEDVVQDILGWVHQGDSVENACNA